MRTSTPPVIKQIRPFWGVFRFYPPILNVARNFYNRNGGFTSLIFDAVIALAKVAGWTNSFIFKKSNFSVLVSHTVVALTGVVSWTSSVLWNYQLGPSSGGAKLSLRHVIRGAATVSGDRLRFR